MKNDECHLYFRLDSYTAGWLTMQMELLMREYADRGIEQEHHPADKAEAFKVASTAASVLATINEAMAAREEAMRCT